MNQHCGVCNIKIDKNNYSKNRTVSKSCYNKNRRKNNKKNTFFQKHQPKSDNSIDDHKKKKKVVNSVNNKNFNKKETKVVDSVNNNKNKTLIIGLSTCGKTYVINNILLQKHQPIFIITKSLNQNPNIKAQTSDEFQPLESYENSTVVFDDMLLSKQESNIDLFFTRGRHNNIDLYYISQNYFPLPKNTIRNNTIKIILPKQTLKDIILLFHDTAGLGMNLEEWKQLCRKT